MQKTADWIAEFSGSIPFLVLHAVLFAVWIVWNLYLPEKVRFDPYPFNFLTMCVSLEAIFLSVFVLLSQNRQAAKDRVRSDIEYDVNLRAELEVAHLHEKMDRLSSDLLTQISRLGDRGGKVPVNAPTVTGARLHDTSPTSGGHGYEAHTEDGV